MSAALALATLLLAAYVLVGAVDLGVGLLLPLVARGRDRDAVLAAGGRPWSALAVWTPVALAPLLAGLPSSLGPLRALWPPLLLMLAALILRAVAAVVRPHVLRRDLADLLFGLASLAAVGGQGLALGWFVAGLGTGLPARHAGPLGAVSIWGLLCAAGLVGLYGLLGAGWLIWSGRGAVRVFGREVGRAAALLAAGATVLCALWSLPTGAAAQTLHRSWPAGAVAAGCGAAALAALSASLFTLWGRRNAMTLACAALAASAGLLGVVVSLSTAATTGPGQDASFAGYLAFVLVIGLPLAAVEMNRRRVEPGDRAPAGAMDGEAQSQAGRRSGSLANSLHLS